MVHQGDLLDVLPTLDAESVDACVTDPPYDLTSGKNGTGFMGLAWDGTGVAFNVETWRAIFRVLKPGAFLVAFGGTRTFHRMTCAIEDAGFEIRDCLSWLYGQGFPKSLNIGDGRGTALKPAWEPIILARKPLSGTVAANVLQHGTGALNINACRIDGEPTHGSGASMGYGGAFNKNAGRVGVPHVINNSGRWPANVVLDEEAAAMLDEQAPSVGGGNKDNRGQEHGFMEGRKSVRDDIWANADERGGASRFFYVAKPSREERDYGTGADGMRNIHPTVKPVELMRWLVKLVVPVNGVCLDPFIGSGTTGMACEYEMRQFIGIEREAKYAELATQRIAAVAPLFNGQVQG